MIRLRKRERKRVGKEKVDKGDEEWGKTAGL